MTPLPVFGVFSLIFSPNYFWNFLRNIIDFYKKKYEIASTKSSFFIKKTLKKHKFFTQLTQKTHEVSQKKTFFHNKSHTLSLNAHKHHKFFHKMFTKVSQNIYNEVHVFSKNIKRHSKTQCVLQKVSMCFANQPHNFLIFPQNTQWHLAFFTKSAGVKQKQKTKT